MSDNTKKYLYKMVAVCRLLKNWQCERWVYSCNDFKERGLSVRALTDNEKEYFIKNYRKKGELLINGYNFH